MHSLPMRLLILLWGVAYLGVMLLQGIHHHDTLHLCDRGEVHLACTTYDQHQVSALNGAELAWSTDSLCSLGDECLLCALSYAPVEECEAPLELQSVSVSSIQLLDDARTPSVVVATQRGSSLRAPPTQVRQTL